MHPKEFDGQTMILAKDQPQYLPLPAFSNGNVIVSCWALTDEDVARIVETRTLWVSQYTFGRLLQPQFVGLDMPPEVAAHVQKLQADEMELLERHFLPADYDALENALALKAASLGWTGDPMKQPCEVVLAAARSVLDGKACPKCNGVPVAPEEPQCHGCMDCDFHGTFKGYRETQMAWRTSL